MDGPQSTLEALELLELEEERHFRAARDSLIYFAETIEIPATVPRPESYRENYPIFVKPAAHHRLILQAYDDMLTGRLAVDGILIMAPPGSAKSSYASVVAPAWTLGRYGKNVITVSYSAELANQWGYRTRQIVRQPVYSQIFPNVKVKDDQGGVASWALTNESYFRSDGILGSLTGFRADVAIFDDLIKGKEAADSQVVRDKVWGAVMSDLFTRLKPGGKVLGIGTRWVEDDPIGRILGEDWKGQSGVWVGTDKRKWFVINLPTKAEHLDDPLGRKNREMLWPEWFRKEEIDRIEDRGGRDWSALHQQRPVANEGAILPRMWWREWKRRDKAGNPEPPECEFIFLAYDTAIEAKEENDYSAMTAWGIFRAPADESRLNDRIVRPGQECFHAILLGAWQERVQSVDLMKKIKEHRAFWPDCDMILVEKKASGHELIQEMKRMRWPVKEVYPRDGAAGRQQSMVPRAHAVAYVLQQGGIWYIPGAMTNKVIDETAAVPYGKHNDMACTVIYALQFFRDSFYLQVPSDFEDKQEAALNDAKWFDERREAKHRRSYDGKPIRFDDEIPVPEGTANRRGYGRL